MFRQISTKFETFYAAHLTTDFRRLALLILLTLIIRVPFLHTIGHAGDMKVNQGWMQSATVLGVAYSYDRQINTKIQTPNHGPVELYLYAFAGHMYEKAFSDNYVEMIQPYHRIFTKFPGVSMEFVIVVCLYFAFLKLRNPKDAFIAAAVYALTPISWHDSAYWGQTDPLYTVLLLIAVLGLARNRVFVASSFFTLALLTKPQALIFAPLFVLFCDRKLVVYLKAAFACVLTSFVTLLPFLLNGNVISSFRDYSEVLQRSGNRLSANAFNFWWAVYGDKAWKPVKGRDIVFGFMELRTIGSLLFCSFVALALFVCWRRLRRGEDRTEQLLLSASVIASAFFMFMTSMHERYYYPYVAFALPLLFLGRHALWSYVALSVFFYLNVWIVLPFGKWDGKLFKAIADVEQYVAFGACAAFAYYIVAYLYCLPRKGIDAQARPLLPAIREGLVRINDFFERK